MSVILRIVVLLFFFCPVEIFGVRTCSTWSGYETNQNCSENNDDTLDVPGQIANLGYTVDTFTVVTEDQYNLTTYRANPTSSNGKVVLLMHGIGMNSLAYTNRKQKSLVYQLLQSGYTVWLGNFRGTKFSRKNAADYTNPKYLEFSFVMERATVLSDLSAKTGKFLSSFYEMGIHDLPALLEFAATNTENFNKLYYIGFSMGTTAGLVLNTEKPEIASKYVKVFINLAPTAFSNHIKTPLRFLAPLWKEIAPGLTDGAFMKQSEAYIRKSCLQTGSAIRACGAMSFIIFGSDFDQLDPLYIPIYILQSPDRIVVKVLSHFIQMLLSGEFQHFDYGETKNLQVYGSAHPPRFNLSKVSVKQKSFVGKNDYLSDVKDVKKLHSLFPEGISDGIYEILYEKWNHADFIVAKDSVPVLYDHVIAYLNNF